MSSITSTISSILNDYYGIKKSTTGTDTTTTAKTTSATGSSTKSYTGTLVGKYFDSVNTETADAKTIFSKLSVDVGSDSKTITKDQLDSFIKDAKSGAVQISDKELSGLTTLQNNWTKIADGADKITYASVRTAGFQDTLTSMAPDKATTTNYAKDAADSTAAAYSKIVNAALEGISSSSDSSTSSTSSLTKLLNNLLKGTTDENDDSNAELISTLTNLIANSNSTTTTEYEA